MPDIFPPVETADEFGLLAVGGELTVEVLLEAYRSGIFPWPMGARYPLIWFSPPRRGVLFLDDVHISRSLAREMKHSAWEFRCDTAFREVITACARSKHRRERATWITPQMIRGYIELHEAGYAHSIECFEDGMLIGGLYGVSIGKMFAGESMFYLKENASKLCLVALIESLSEQNCRWVDCQQVTPLLQSFGARESPREDFLLMLKTAIADEPLKFPFPTRRLTR